MQYQHLRQLALLVGGCALKDFKALNRKLRQLTLEVKQLREHTTIDLTKQRTDQQLEVAIGLRGAPARVIREPRAMSIRK